MTLPEVRATIEVLEPPEGRGLLRDYRVPSEGPGGGARGPCWELAGSVPPRARILELVREGQPGHAALTAIVRPAARAAPRGLARPLDEDARRFLARALPPPSPCLSTPEPQEKRVALPSPELETGVSLAEELREAEKCESWRTAPARPASSSAGSRAGPEEPGAALCAAARRLDALLAESRALHADLAAIHRDLQVLARRTPPRV